MRRFLNATTRSSARIARRCAVAGDTATIATFFVGFALPATAAIRRVVKVAMVAAQIVSARVRRSQAARWSCADFLMERRFREAHWIRISARASRAV
jgi:hypothetical protein